MKNKYEVRGEVTAIFLKAKGVTLETLISTEDLERVKDISTTWWPSWSKDTQTYYVYTNKSIGGGKQKTIYLHRFVLEAPKEKQVDHINHNTLDNRRTNLRLVNHSQNQQNRAGAQRNNKSSGIRGITWCVCHKKWMGNIRVNKKSVWRKYFDTLEEAANEIKKARAIHMPYSRDAGVKHG